MSQTFTNDIGDARMSHNGKQDPFLNGLEITSKNGKSKLTLNKNISENGKLYSIN